MPTLQINHVNPLSKEQPEFQAQGIDGKRCAAVSLTPPAQKMVGTHNVPLSQDLQWYLERFLEVPTDIDRARADDILKTLETWGRECFETLFSGQAQNWYQDARRGGLENLTIRISSDDPEVLSWPWEALYHATDGYIAQHCRIERQLSAAGDPRPFSAKLPQKQLNILYIIARPYGGGDVGFQSIARPLTDFAAEGNWPVHIDLLRPPTFDRLLEVLREKPNYYHIVHFDGHGGAPKGSGERFGQGGVLVFEKDEPDPQHEGDPIPADQLSTLLFDHNVPYIILNACQSASYGTGGDPFTSVAASLLRAGARGVVAMSYSLWVSGAEVFVPAFYRRLFESGDIAEAMRAGRQAMYRHNERDTFLGETEFQDWLVPVLYHQTTGEKILPALKKGTAARESRLPLEARRLTRRDFIGRSGAIQRLEHAMRHQRQAGILIHGMAGEGKTTLAMGFLKWLEDTGGLGNGAIWFGFEGIHSAAYVIDTLTDRLFGTQAMALEAEQKLALITQALRENPVVMVWDNFESVLGYGGVKGLMPEDDRKVLKRLLGDLRDGKTKVLITSRSTEEWLDARVCFRLHLEGLRGGELWQYCNAVLQDLGLKIDRDDPQYRPLIDKLQGNPLAIRVILMRLGKCSARSLLDEWNRGDLQDNGSDDPETERLLNTLAVFNGGFDAAFAPVLRLVGLHEQFVNANFIKQMLDNIGEPTACVHGCFDMLVKAGLCHEVMENGYRTHPALRASLNRHHPAKEPERRAFVDCMGTLCNKCDGKPLHEQRPVFERFGMNFRNALELARDLDMRDDICMLLSGLGNYAHQSRHFEEAERIYKEYIQAGETFERFQSQATACHQLGIVAQERRNFDAAEDWYKQALEVESKQGDEHSAASTYHQLGIVAQERRNFDAAEGWYKQSLEIELKQGNEHGAALTYHQLGRVAQEREDFDAAEGWYKKSLEIKLKQGDERGAASTYHQLGTVAQEYEDFDAAEDWYKKALEIELKQGDERGAASTYHELGIVAQERRDFDAAEGWYKKSLEIKLKQGNEHGAASTYGQLGNFAEKRGDLPGAEKLYQTAYKLFTRHNDPFNAEKALSGLRRVQAAQGGGYAMTANQTLLQTLATSSPDWPAFAAALPESLRAADAPQQLADDVAALLCAERPELTAYLDSRQPPRAQKMGFIPAALTVGAVLFLLQTHIVIERQGQDGKFYFRVEHKAINDALVVKIAETLKGLLPKK